jgi:hypothetical protein
VATWESVTHADAPEDDEHTRAEVVNSGFGVRPTQLVYLWLTLGHSLVLFPLRYMYIQVCVCVCVSVCVCVCSAAHATSVLGHSLVRPTCCKLMPAFGSAGGKTATGSNAAVAACGT